MNGLKVFFTLFFAAIIVAIVFTSKSTGAVITGLGTGLKDVSQGILGTPSGGLTSGG